MRRIIWIVGLLVLAIVLAPLIGVKVPFGPRTSLAIVSGSENTALEPIIQDWARNQGVDVTVTYQGSLDIARVLQQGGDGAFDAVWPANGLWIELGDTDRLVRHSNSILRSPVVLGLRKSIAARLGWVGRQDVTIAEIAQAAQSGAFRLAITSATQSNSGASAYLGFLHAFAGQPDVLTLEHLADPAVQAKTAALLGAVDRSSGSSGWLKDALVANPTRFDAMINYESLVIEANQALTAQGIEPLHVVYPADGMAVADSPLGYVPHGDAARETAFLALQQHLLSPDVQTKLTGLGRRASLIGLGGGSDPAVWNPGWGVDPARPIAPIPTPTAAVIREALRLYQTDLRKPSLTVWLLDVSGSMEGEPLAQMKSAMASLFDPAAAGVDLLQPSTRDISIIIPFSSDPQPSWRVDGNDPAALAAMAQRVAGLQAGGGTDLYGAGLAALDQIDRIARDGRIDGHLPAIIALTDGASDTSNRAAFLAGLAARAYGRDMPIHAIALGQADEAQLDELNAETVGRLFDGHKGLDAALRNARGYN